MAHRDEIVHAIFRELRCPVCPGVMRYISLASKEEYKGSEIRPYKHQCSSCGLEYCDSEKWPVMIYRDREFRLQDYSGCQKDDPGENQVVSVEFGTHSEHSVQRKIK